MDTPVGELMTIVVDRPDAGIESLKDYGLFTIEGVVPVEVLGVSVTG